MNEEAEKPKHRGTALPFLAKWRAVRGKTQRDLAKESGVSQVAIARLETGKYTAKVSTVSKLATGLGISTLELMRDPGIIARSTDQDRSEHNPSSPITSVTRNSVATPAN